MCAWTSQPPEWLWSQEGYSWLFLFLVLLNIGPFCYFSYIMEHQPSLNCFLQYLHHFWQVPKHGVLHSCYQMKSVPSGRALELFILMAFIPGQAPHTLRLRIKTCFSWNDIPAFQVGSEVCGWHLLVLFYLSQNRAFILSVGWGWWWSVLNCSHLATPGIELLLYEWSLGGGNFSGKKFQQKWTGGAVKHRW